MADFDIPQHFNKQFTTNVELLLQQNKPVMLQGVTVKSYQGEAAQVVKQFGEVEFQEKLTRNSDTEFSDLAHKQRWLFPTDYDLALPIDSEDELRMLNSPTSSYALAMRAAWARRINDTVRDGALGDNKTGKNGGTTTSFDTTNQQIASGSAGLTVSKLRQTKEILLGNDVEPGTPMYFAYTHKQMTDLLATTEVTSSDYNSVKALVMGDVDTFMGFKFILNTRLGVDGASARRCIAWAEGGLVLGQWRGLTTRIDERPDKKYITQIFSKGTIDACRTQEEKVVEILCTES
jgi:hypothetical protein